MKNLGTFNGHNDKQYFKLMMRNFFSHTFNYIYILSISFSLILACQAQPDPGLADVFSPLDGTWKGTFIVYVDSTGQQKGESQPRITDPEILQRLPLKESARIDVQQIYKSESSYYQTVKITDTYEDGSGEKKVVNSEGYNKVEGNKLICVVNKPDEQVVHKGSIPEENVIIWERSILDPTKIEYFYETVKADTYSILGWGYYGDDDPTLRPKTWFYAEYVRQK